MAPGYSMRRGRAMVIIYQMICWIARPDPKGFHDPKGFKGFVIMIGQPMKFIIYYLRFWYHTIHTFAFVPNRFKFYLCLGELFFGGQHFPCPLISYTLAGIPEFKNRGNDCGVPDGQPVTTEKIEICPLIENRRAVRFVQNVVACKLSAINRCFTPYLLT